MGKVHVILDHPSYTRKSVLLTRNQTQDLEKASAEFAGLYQSETGFYIE